MKTQTWITRALLPGAAVLALAVTPPARADYQSTVVSQGPVGYWRLNETTQPQATAPAANLGSLGATANGTYNNFPTRGLPGPFTDSVAVGLNGSSVTTPWNADLNSAAFAVEMWVNPAQMPVFNYIASSVHIASPRSGWYLAQDDGSTFGAGSAFVVRMFYQNGATPGIQLAAPVTVANTWYHLVLTYNGTTASLYTNGVLADSGAPLGYIGNVDSQLSVGSRSDNLFYWPGQVAEVALYKTGLSAAQVANHYTTATTTPANYSTTVLADSPALYQRFREAADPPAANLGTLGGAASGLYIYNVAAGAAGPIAPPYVGFDAANKAASFNGGGGVVRIPNLNLNTNTVTISGWVKANGSQPLGAGLVLCGSGASATGLTFDQVSGGLGLGYIWAGNNYGISPSTDLGLPQLPDNDWAYVALVIQPSQAAMFVCDRNNFANFLGVTNSFNVNHLPVAFNSPTLFGAESGSTVKNFNGSLDEVAIFNRALGAGELYTQYGAAVGGVPPRVFDELQGPAEIYNGDPLVLRIDAGGTPPLTYTWKKGTTTLGTTTVGVFRNENPTPLDSGYYEVAVSNGSGSVSSQQVFVNVVAGTAPQITDAQGFKNRTLYTGATLRMSIAAIGGGLKYQWYKDSTAIASATNSVFSLTSVGTTNAGSYSVSITNTLGTASNAPVVITIPAAATGSYEALMVTAKPESWYRLDETGGTNLFDAMGRHDGYYTSLNGSDPAVTFGAAGALNNNADTAVTFTPAKQGVGVVPYSPALNPKIYTMEAWVKTTVTTAEIYPLSSSFGSTGWYWRTLSGFWNGNNAPVQDNGMTTAAVIPGAWTHVVITADHINRYAGANPYAYYVNGQGDAGYWWTGPDLNTAGPLIIGGHGVSASTLANGFFDGQVDEVAIYPRILTLAEIQSHFQGRFGANSPPEFLGTLTSQTVPAGAAVTFSTTVQGTTPISLQWYKDGTRLTGATTATLNFSSVLVTDTGTYTLWATNAAGVRSISGTLTVIAPVGYANVTNGLVLHLKFDGDTTDSSGRNNNGTAVGGPAFVTGIIGSQALEYTTTVNTNVNPVAVDTTSYVNLGRPADLLFDATTSFSIGLWVKLPTNYDAGDLPFIGTAINSMNNPGWDIGPTYGGGGWQWCLNDGVTASIVTNNIDVNGPAGSFNSGGWHHFMLTVDRAAKAATSYVDGVLTATRDITALGNLDNGNPIIMGQDPTFLYPEAGSAAIDDLGIWRRALTQVEAINIFTAGSTGSHSFDSPAPPITITMTKSGNSVTLNWVGGTLLQSDSLAAGAVWSPVPGASAPSFTVTPGTGAKFYKVLAQ